MTDLVERRPIFATDEDIREFIELRAAYAVAEQMRPDCLPLMRSRRRGQAMLCYDLLRLLNGRREDLEAMRESGLVGLNETDLDPIVRGGWDGRETTKTNSTERAE